MAVLSSSDITAVLKEIYPDGAPKEVLYGGSPLLALLPETTSAGGELFKIPLMYGDPQGRSATFATGQTNMTASKWTGFDVTYVDDYGFWGVSGKVIAQTRNDNMAFVRHLKAESMGAMRQLKRSISHALYRNGGGALSRIAATSTVGSTAITIDPISDSVFFEVNQEIAASSADGTSGSLRTGTATITAIDRIAGTLTTDSNWSSQITSLSATSGTTIGDYLFVAGDFGAKAKGLDAWIPSSAPGATSFFGVDRSVDTMRLGGVRYDGSSQLITEALIDAIELVFRHGGTPDLVVLHPKQFAYLQKLLDSKCIFETRMSEKAEVGFEAIKFRSPSGTVDVIADRDCQPTVAWILQTDTWKIASLGELMQVLDDDGLSHLRQATADAVEGRIVSRWNLACAAPGWNGRCTLVA